ncbi:M15 family metallopeptidase [Solirubrobacter sp. CPCC 204708]|uniref:M15 family metallopeptidase n=1 Tax=Solirubrobacter deserti TaxID=2282478 RepID=A0ABT4RGI8_9ACTN|nr:M15 family metallopeptidase [Solirubrobacter deserti]MDA0137671.1 M15 family metallopeptidase [Solirubrobacter deserti]
MPSSVLVYQSLTSYEPSPAYSSETPAPPIATPPAIVDQRPEARTVDPDRVTVFDDVPGVTRLDPDLLGALRAAAADAETAGVEFVVNSGWRPAEYQEHLRREAIAQYGSEAEAARWVATPETSPHVSGDAVDIGPSASAAWLSAHGAQYGLCQIYRNEPWHFELRPEAVDGGCPAMYADPTQDPRMQP